MYYLKIMITDHDTRYICLVSKQIPHAPAHKPSLMYMIKNCLFTFFYVTMYESGTTRYALNSLSLKHMLSALIGIYWTLIIIVTPTAEFGQRWNLHSVFTRFESISCNEYGWVPINHSPAFRLGHGLIGYQSGAFNENPCSVALCHVMLRTS